MTTVGVSLTHADKKLAAAPFYMKTLC